jgi:hypothetical protein
MLGRNEVGIAATQVHDIDPLRLELPRLVRDGKRW